MAIAKGSGAAVESIRGFFAQLDRSLFWLKRELDRIESTATITHTGVYPSLVKRQHPEATAKARRQWKNQGQYMGLLKSLSLKERAAAKKVYAKNGIVSAIAMATGIKKRKLANGGRRSASRGKDK